MDGTRLLPAFFSSPAARPSPGLRTGGGGRRRIAVDGCTICNRTRWSHFRGALQTGNTASPGRRRGRLSPSRLELYWKDLGGEDAAAAYRAVRALAADPALSVPFLAGRMRRNEPADPAQAERLLADLSPDAFEVRGHAVIQSHRLGQDPGTGAEWSRQRRAVMALECSATPVACQLLRTLASTDAADRLAEQARAALDRLSGAP